MLCTTESARTTSPSRLKKAVVPLLVFEQRTLLLATPGKALTSACLALQLQTKNLRNAAHFAVNNVLTAYERVEPSEPSLAADPAPVLWRLKADLHENQCTALGRFNVAIDRLNRACQAKYDLLQQAALESEDNAQKAVDAVLRLLPRLEPEVASVFRSALDLTVLDNVLREWPGQDGKPLYGRLPAKAAQQTLRSYLAGWSGYFQSLKRFAAGGSAMTGQPRPPGYLAKHSRFVLELPLTQLGELLIGLGARRIPTNFEESLALTEAELTAWNSYRIRDAVATACTRRGFAPTCEPQHLRIVPHKSGVKFEVVVRVARTVPADSLLAKLELELGAALLDAGSKRNDVLGEAIAARPNLRACGIDFGVSNTAALAFNTGAQAKVISAGRLEAVLGRFDAALDARVSALTTPVLRELQSRKEAGLKLEPPQKLPLSDEMALRKGLKALYADPAYLLLRGQRERWLADYLHKLSYAIVALCAERNVEALVLGKNSGWKDGMNLGRTQNRRFGNVPIARLIEQIRYKAEAKGLVVVTTEESYTSKTSFVNDEVLKNISAERKRESKDKKAKEAPWPVSGSVAAATSVGAIAPTSPSLVAKTAPLGKRSKDERHTFVNYHQTGRWAEVHADVNAAFNMLRKVFKGFAYHAGLTLKYTLMRVSPRLGLTAITNSG
jgi:IS605 OrfB family transposase